MCAQLLSGAPVAAAAQTPGAANVDWDTLIAAEGHVDFPGGIRVVPQTPLIGANLTGLDLTKPLTQAELEVLTSAFLRYKVLMIRSGGNWKMDLDQHTQFCQQISQHWGLFPDTSQKRMNNSAGMSVHPFLPWQRGYPHIWPTGSVTQGGKQATIRHLEDNENFEAYEGRKITRRKRMQEAREKKEASSTEKKENASQGYATGDASEAELLNAAKAKDDVMNGANGFHWDDGFFHQPPSAVVLNSIALPKVGGDTIFADMGAAYRGLPEALRERAKELTATMSWDGFKATFVAEAKRRAEDGDNSYWDHVEKLKQDYPPSLQPVIRMHPQTGELSIYANRGFTNHINDVSAKESADILQTLTRMAERPEYQARMRWKDVGDVCVYDNRITQHYAVADYGKVGARALHHIALLGEPTKNAYGEVIGDVP